MWLKYKKNYLKFNKIICLIHFSFLVIIVNILKD